jgi:phosphoribosyl 1,2-cyclic phosphodiesterase
MKNGEVGAMRFASLGSGSRGNGTLIEAGATCVLVDCGFTMRDTEARLARLGKTAANVTAILVTHEHSDHIGGVVPFARRHNLPVWMTVGTRANSAAGELPSLRFFSSHERFAIGDLEIDPFPVPHDAREPAQFVFGDGKVRLGLLTDVGAVTPHVEARLSGCDALVLECNHDPHLLATGPYPPPLRERVGGRYGHLSNGQAAALLEKLDCGRLQHVVAAHLSEKNNTPALARAALSRALNCADEWIATAHQERGLDWRQIA